MSYLIQWTATSEIAEPWVTKQKQLRIGSSNLLHQRSLTTKNQVVPSKKQTSWSTSLSYYRVLVISMATSFPLAEKNEAAAAGKPSSIGASPPESVPTEVKDSRENIPTLQIVLVLVPVTLVYFLVMLDNSIIATAIPSITSEFNSLLDVGWYENMRRGISLFDSTKRRIC